jgi:hypothetical protein
MVFTDSSIHKIWIENSNPYFFWRRNSEYMENVVHFSLPNNVFAKLNFAIGNFASEQLIPGVVARGEGEEHSPLPVPNHKELGQGHVLGHLRGHKVHMFRPQNRLVE